MIRRSLSYVICLLLAGALQVRARAEKVTVHLDAGQSEIHWTLGDVMHTVRGTFRMKGGLLIFDTTTGVALGEILVDTASGESGSHARDAKMQKEVLESDKYPEAFFHPTKVSGSWKAGEMQDMRAEGTFNIHGADHPITLQLKVQTDGQKVTATTHFVIPYVEWGMKDPSVLMMRVAKQVDVDVTARGSVEANK